MLIVFSSKWRGVVFLSYLLLNYSTLIQCCVFLIFFFKKMLEKKVGKLMDLFIQKNDTCPLEIFPSVETWLVQHISLGNCGK